MSKDNKRGINPIIDEINLSDVDQLYRQELKRVLNDKKLLSELEKRGILSELVDGNLGNILDFESTHLECDAFHKIHGDKPCGTQIVEIFYDGSKVARQLGQCPHQLKVDQMRGRYIYSDFPANWINNRISNVDVQRNRAVFLTELLAIIKGEKNWLYGFGPSGRGKAFMVVSALNEIAIANPLATFAFVDFPNLVSENMVDYFANRASVDRVVSVLSGVDYLVLNHFGNEELSELVRSAITMPLLSSRDSQGKTTIILSNIGLDQLTELHRSGKNNQVRAGQLIDIIRDNIKSPIQLVGAKIYE